MVGKKIVVAHRRVSGNRLISIPKIIAAILDPKYVTWEYEVGESFVKLYVDPVEGEKRGDAGADDSD